VAPHGEEVGVRHGGGVSTAVGRQRPKAGGHAQRGWSGRRLLTGGPRLPREAGQAESHPLTHGPAPQCGSGS
jgi:hypothetical protein